MRTETQIPDELGQELGENASVWTVYAKEAKEYDSTVMDAWNRSTDVMLIFAALFSAVLTAFIIESYKNLSRSPQDVTNALLQDIASRIGTGSESSPSTSAMNSAFVAPASAVWINALWFASLTCSLGVGSLAMLVKQWLNAYLITPSASPRMRAHLRQHRFDTLMRWRTGAIVSALPLALSLSLMLFLAGLAILLFGLNMTVAIASVVLIALTVVIHIASLVLPAICDCPWKTAISPGMFWALFPLREVMRGCMVVFRASRCFCGSAGSFFVHWSDKAIKWAHPERVVKLSRRRPARSLEPDPWEHYSLRPAPRTTIERAWEYLHRYRLVVPPYASKLMHDVGWISTAPYTSFMSVVRRMLTFTTKWRTVESETAHERATLGLKGNVLDARSIVWLMQSSDEQVVTGKALTALAGLSPDEEGISVIHTARLPKLIASRLEAMVRNGTSPDPISVELYARAMIRLRGRTGGRGGYHDLFACAARVIRGDYNADARATCVCAGAMLTEMVDMLEAHCMGTLTIGPFHLHLLVNTLGHEFSWRKRKNVEFGATTAGGTWSDDGLSKRSLRLLIQLLDIAACSWPNTAVPTLLDTAVSLTLAALILGQERVDWDSYTFEEPRQRDFHHLIVDSLSRILRFPSSYGCDDVLLDVVREKHALACRGPTHVSGSTRVKNSPSSIEVLSSLNLLSEGQEDVLLTLSRVDASSLRSLDCGPIVAALRGGSSYRAKSNALICLENVVACSGTGPLISPDLTEHLTRMICAQEGDIWLRRQAFRLLLRCSEAVLHIRPSWVASLGTLDSAAAQTRQIIHRMMAQGLLHAFRAFFLDPAALTQEEFDRLVEVLAGLATDHRDQLAKSRAVEAVLSWSQTWHGTLLTSNSTVSLLDIAQKVGVKVDSDDTSWFRPSAISKSGRHMSARV